MNIILTHLYVFCYSNMKQGLLS